jgi:dienelactone hydrolase
MMLKKSSLSLRQESLEWHFFPFAGHGFVDPGTAGYHPHTAYLAWPLVVDFLERELSD